MKSTGKCLSERYVLNGIIESRFCDAYAYIFDYIFNSIFTILSLLLHWNKGLIFIDLSLIICATGLYTGYISNIRRHHES